MNTRQATIFALYTGLNPYGITLTLSEIGRVLDMEPKDVSNTLDKAKYRLIILRNQKLL